MKEHAVGRTAPGPLLIIVLASVAFFGACGSGSVDLTTERTAAHSVELSWTASTSPNVAGYNIYRSTSPEGPFTKINSTQVLATHYTDINVASGMTYYYAATAVDSGGRESAYSKLVQADVP